MRNPLLYFILCCGIVSAQDVKAQTALTYTHTYIQKKDAAKRISRYRQRAHAMLQKQETQRIEKLEADEKTSSSVHERLIATAKYNYITSDTFPNPLGIIDSMHLVYSGSRGSSFNNNLVGFQFPDNNEFDPGTNPTAYYSDGETDHSVYNVSETEVLPDSMLLWSFSQDTPTLSGQAYRLSEKRYSGYDMNNNATFLTFIDYPFDSSVYCSFYTSVNTFESGSNNITGSYDVNWNYSPPGWDTLDYTIYTYNSNGWLIEDSESIGEIDHYYYNSSGNLDSIISGPDSVGFFLPQYRIYIYYNADNTLKTDSESSLNTFITPYVWYPSEKDSFGYTPGVNYWTFLQNYGWDNVGLFWYRDVYSKHVSPSGLPDTVYYTMYNAGFTPPSYIQNGSKTSYTYDTYNNPATAYEYDLVITDSATGAGYYDTTGNMTTHYYYETYLASFVDELPETTANIVIFPNPTTTTLTIMSPSAIDQVTITNLLGQTLYTHNYNTEKVEVDVADLPTGVYVVKINGSEVREFVKE